MVGKGFERLGKVLCFKQVLVRLDQVEQALVHQILVGI